jgi:hypothetical protein
VVHPELRNCCDRWAVEDIGGVEEAAPFVSMHCRRFVRLTYPPQNASQMKKSTP